MLRKTNTYELWFSVHQKPWVQICTLYLQRRYTRVNSQGGSLYGGPGPEYDDPANCAPEDDQYGSQYGGKQWLFEVIKQDHLTHLFY